MIRDTLLINLKAEEGLRLSVYDDITGAYLRAGSRVLGHPTIGYGCNLESPEGITQAEADYLLANRVQLAQDQCALLPYFSQLSPERQDAVTDMMFNMGSATLATFYTFHNFMSLGDYAGAADDLRRTAWYGQVHARAERIAQIIATGVWEAA